jgi:hypothetical protein
MWSMIRWRLLLLVGVAALLTACSVYDKRYAYKPMTAEVRTPVAGAGGFGPPVTLVQVVGVRRGDERSGQPASVDVRLKIRNTSAKVVTFDPQSLVLWDASAGRFHDPVLRPPDVLSLEPDQTAVVEATFPLPGARKPDDLDLSALSVRWQLEVAGRAVDASADFVLLPTTYYDRYPNRVGVGFQRYDRGGDWGQSLNSE